jgi:hypothetical protein
MKTYILYIDSEDSIKYANECLDSCKQYNIDAELYKGLMGYTNDQLKEIYGFSLGRSKDDSVFHKEYCATIGHFLLWKKIAQSNKPCVILEHDAIIKQNYDNLTIKDNQIVFLGPRIVSNQDYIFPNCDIDYIRVNQFCGAHGYAITPKTAQYLIEQIEQKNHIRIPIDGLLGVINEFNLELIAVDPPHIVCEVGNRNSTANDVAAEYNAINTPKFIKGIADETKIPKLFYAYDFSVDWFTVHTPFWLDCLAAQKIDTFGKLDILEVGSFEGKSSTWISDNLLSHPDSSLFCVDTFEGSVEHVGWDGVTKLKEKFLRNVSLSKNSKKIKVAIGKSSLALPHFRSENKKFDLIYIDGSHKTSDVICDGINAFALLKEGGLLIFDDYQWSYDGITPVATALDILEKDIPELVVVGYGWQKAYTI